MKNEPEWESHEKGVGMNLIDSLGAEGEWEIQSCNYQAPDRSHAPQSATMLTTTFLSAPQFHFHNVHLLI